MDIDSENHVYLYYDMYAGYVGFSVYKDWWNKSKADCTTYHIPRKYCCYKAGFKREVELCCNVVLLFWKLSLYCVPGLCCNLFCCSLALHVKCLLVCPACFNKILCVVYEISFLCTSDYFINKRLLVNCRKPANIKSLKPLCCSL